MSHAVLSILLTQALTAQGHGLTEYAQRVEGITAFGAYIGGTKIGWLVEEYERGARDGENVLIKRSELSMTIAALGEKDVLEYHEEIIYSLRGNGKILAATSVEVEGGTKTHTDVLREGDALKVTRKSPAGETSRVVPMPKAQLIHAMKFEQWMEADREVGDRFTGWSIEWDAEDVDLEEVSLYRGVKNMIWGGKPVEAHHVVTESEGMTSDSFYVLPLRLIGGHELGIIEIRAEDPKTVRRLSDETVDLFAFSSIGVDVDLGPPQKLGEVTLRVTGVGDFVLPTSHRQQVEKQADGSYRVVLKRDYRVKEKRALSKEEREHYLRATPAVECNHEKIQALAKELKGTVEDPVEVTHRIQHWVYENLEATTAANSSSAANVLEKRAGDCTESALLFTALARAAGLPARQVSGLIYVGEGLQAFGWHAWAQIHDGGQWVSVDPSWNEVFVSPTRLLLDEEEEDGDFSYFNLMADLKIDVLSKEGVGDR